MVGDNSAAGDHVSLLAVDNREDTSEGEEEGGWTYELGSDDGLGRNRKMLGDVVLGGQKDKLYGNAGEEVARACENAMESDGTGMVANFLVSLAQQNWMDQCRLDDGCLQRHLFQEAF